MSVTVLNIAVLQGSLSRPPEVRQLPSGDLLVNYEVTVPAATDRKAESVPVCWFGAPQVAQTTALPTCW